MANAADFFPLGPRSTTVRTGISGGWYCCGVGRGPATPALVPLSEILHAEDLPNPLDVLGSNEELLLGTGDIRTSPHLRRQELHLETFGSAGLRDHLGAKEIATDRKGDHVSRRLGLS